MLEADDALLDGSLTWAEAEWQRLHQIVQQQIVAVAGVQHT